MNKWLAKLHEHFLDEEPFVVATVSAYHGSSPDSPGVALFYSAIKSQRFIKSDQRHEKMLKTAAVLLTDPAPFHTEEFTLGNVAGADNGYCDVVYEYFDARQYPAWLAALRKHSHEGLCCTLLREFDIKNSSGVIRTEVLNHTDSKKLTMPYGHATRDCIAQTNENSLLLLRSIRADTIAVTLVGNHPVIDEIQKQCLHLPIKITRADNKAEHHIKNDIVIIMTTDHELDYQFCESTLKHQNGKNNFVGCIGSEKKADIFKNRLMRNGVSESQLHHFYMPVGIQQISGKQNSVVAASIVAQILMHHTW